MIRAPVLPACCCLAWLLPALGGCTGVQSALDPAGREAEVLAGLFWLLLAGAVVLWLLINGLFLYVMRIEPRPLSRRLAEGLIIGGGILLPTVLLAGLLAWSLSLMPAQRAPGTGPAIRVTGEQWWWRVEYLSPNENASVVAANELRLPVGARSELELVAARVIHSFWVPSLAGKVDMIPGRTNRLALEPVRTGTFRGQCAEFCGLAHALMAFDVVVMEPEAFAVWLAEQRKPAVEPASDAARRGRDVFLAEGCGACHAIRGTPANGRVGPDLTHVGSRATVAAGTLPAEAAALARWIAHPDLIKPGARMPAYDALAPSDLADLARYLEGLR